MNRKQQWSEVFSVLPSRPWLLTLLLSWFLWSLAGCGALVEPNRSVVLPEPILPVDTDDSMSEFKPIVVSAGADQFDQIRTLLGPSNVIRFEKPHEIAQEKFLLKLPAGMTVRYDMMAEHGEFDFDRPYPTVQVKAGPFHVSPLLKKIHLQRDGSAKAVTSLGSYSFSWIAKAGAAAMAEDQKQSLVTMWSMPSEQCAACARMEKELSAAKEKGQLPFDYRIIKDEKDRPEWILDFPTPTWVVGETIYTPHKRENGKLVPRGGWYGVEDLIKHWKSTQKQP